MEERSVPLQDIIVKPYRMSRWDRLFEAQSTSLEMIIKAQVVDDKWQLDRRLEYRHNITKRVGDQYKHFVNNL